MKLRELFVQLGIEADSKQVKEFDQALGNVQRSMRDLVGWAGKMSAAFAGVFAGLGLVTKQSAEFAEEAVRTANAFNMSTDQYQELRFAFQSLNASSDDLHDSLQSIQRAVWRSEEGIKTYTRSLAGLGLQYQDLQGMGAGDQFNRIVLAAREAQAAGQDVSGQLAQIFGSDLSRRILPGILSTEGSFEKFQRMARESGLVIEEDMLIRATEAQLKFRELGATIAGMTRLVGIRLAPAFQRLAESVTTALLSVSQYFNEVLGRFSRFFEEEIAKFIKYFKNLNNFVEDSLGGWTTIVGILSGAFFLFQAAIGGILFRRLLKAFARLKVAAVGLNKPLLLVGAKFIALGGYVIFLALVIEDMIGYVNGVDSSFGNLTERMIDTGGIVGFLGGLLQGIVGLMVLLIDVATAFGRRVVSQFAGMEAEVGTFLDLLALVAAFVGTALVMNFTVAFMLIYGAIQIVVAIVVVFLKILHFIVEGIKTIYHVGGFVFRSIGNFFSDVASKARAFLNILKQIASVSFGGLTDMISTVGEGLSGLFGRGGRGAPPPGSGSPPPPSAGAGAIRLRASDLPRQRGGGGNYTTINQNNDIDVTVDGQDPEKIDKKVGEKIAKESQNAMEFDFLASQYGLGR